jgi:DNA-binding CsgD family transcriptional regulator
MMAGGDARRAARIAAAALPPVRRQARCGWHRRPAVAPRRRYSEAGPGGRTREIERAIPVAAPESLGTAVLHRQGEGGDLVAGGSAAFMLAPPLPGRLTAAQEADRTRRLAEYESRHAAGLHLRTGEPLTAAEARSADGGLDPAERAELGGRLRQVVLARHAAARRWLVAQAEAGGRLGRLTPRQRQVWDLWAGGLSTPQIAERLGTPRNAASTHYYAALARLGLPGISGAMAQLDRQARRRRAGVAG